MAEVKNESASTGAAIMDALTGNVKIQAAPGIQYVAIDYAKFDEGLVVTILNLDTLDLLLSHRSTEGDLEEMLEFAFRLLSTIKAGDSVEVFHDLGKVWNSEAVRDLAKKHGVRLTTAIDSQLRSWSGRMERFLKEAVNQ